MSNDIQVAAIPTPTRPADPEGNGKPSRRGAQATLLIALLCVAFSWQRDSAPDNWTLNPAPPREPGTDEASIKPFLVSDAIDRFVHAASITRLHDGRLLAAWFSGSREGAKDVEILGAYFDPVTQRWGEDQILASRRSTRLDTGRYIRKLGNPIVSQAPDGRLWLFYVSVSVGGWAGSAINMSYSEDAGNHWSPTERIITSPFFNISTLLKGTPFYYQDGSMGLPVYHEFLGKFAELLRLSPQGKVLDKSRITHGKHSLQPVILASGEHSATALMRFAGKPPRRMLVSHSQDGGDHWQDAYPANVANPNSALSAVRLDNGDILGVMNDTDDGRHRLSLMQSPDDGRTWHHLTLLDGGPEYASEEMARDIYTEQLQHDLLASSDAGGEGLWQRYSQHLDKRVCRSSGCRFIFDYPYMIQDETGDFHIVYTWNKSFIKHLRFNQAWLDTLQ